MVHLEFLSVSFAWFILTKIRFTTICRLCNIIPERQVSWLWTMSCCQKEAAEPSTVAFKNQMELPPTVSGRISLLEIQETGCNKWDFILGKPSCKKSVVFFNIVQKAFDPPHYGLTGCPIKTQKCLKKCGMVPKSAEWWQGIWNINFFCQSLKITSDILRCIRYSALQCHLAAAFYFKINVASFIFSDLSSDVWTFSC